MCFHYYCVESLFLTLLIVGVTGAMIGIREKRVRPLNDLILLIYEGH